VDHQGGVTLGRTIAVGTTLDYEPLDTDEIFLISEPFGEIRFRIGELERSHWARYAQAAARVLPGIRRGMRAYVRGPLAGAGLSSSASVGLAYLKALADVNDINLAREELVHLDYELERGQLGLQNGLLDPLAIVHGRKDAFLFIDTRRVEITSIPDPVSRGFAWIVAYSGVSRELTKSGFNVRVEECHQAASLLQEGAHILSEVPVEVFHERKQTLPANLRKRGEHYFTEVERVIRGAQAWQAGEFEHFGQMMNRSCASSISNYESGSEILIELHELVGRTNGIYGSRFSGGGYGGCVVALVQSSLADSACQEISERFSTFHPELASRVFVANTGDGLS
jgi:galactokinase